MKLFKRLFVALRRRTAERRWPNDLKKIRREAEQRIDAFIKPATEGLRRP